MIDHFAVLNEPRRPWLDPDEVQAKFVSLSAATHPDRVHTASVEERDAANQRFTELNAARHCLSEPRRRLRHLLELERGASLSSLEQLPSRTAERYFKLGQTCREIDRFLADRPEAVSPLLTLRFLERAMAWSDVLREFQAELEGKRASLESKVRSMNALWDRAPEIGNADRPRVLPLDELERIYRELSYVLRWIEQVRERFVELSL